MCTQTWSNPALFDRLGIVTIYVVGQTPSAAVQRELEREHATYGDLVQGDFIDTYHNLSIKTTVGLHWIWLNCYYPQHTHFIFKADDDTFVQAGALVELLQDAAAEAYTDGVQQLGEKHLPNADTPVYRPIRKNKHRVAKAAAAAAEVRKREELLKSADAVNRFDSKVIALNRKALPASRLDAKPSVAADAQPSIGVKPDSAQLANRKLKPDSTAVDRIAKANPIRDPERIIGEEKAASNLRHRRPLPGSGRGVRVKRHAVEEQQQKAVDKPIANVRNWTKTTTTKRPFYIDSTLRRPERRFYCLRWRRMPVIRNEKSKWHVSEDMYPLRTYPGKTVARAKNSNKNLIPSDVKPD